MRLTLQHTFNDLEKGDLLMGCSKYGHFFVLFVGRGKTGKTMRLLSFEINPTNKYYQEQKQKYGFMRMSGGYNVVNMLYRWDEPFMVVDKGSTPTMDYYPIDPTTLPPEAQAHYQALRTFLEC